MSYWRKKSTKNRKIVKFFQLIIVVFLHREISCVVASQLTPTSKHVTLINLCDTIIHNVDNCGAAEEIQINSVCSGGSRIFPRVGRQLPKVLLFFNFFAENCMKMKEFRPPGGGARVPGAPPLDPPMVCTFPLSRSDTIYA